MFTRLLLTVGWLMQRPCKEAPRTLVYIDGCYIQFLNFILDTAFCNDFFYSNPPGNALSSENEPPKTKMTPPPQKNGFTPLIGNPHIISAFLMSSSPDCFICKRTTSPKIRYPPINQEYTDH